MLFTIDSCFSMKFNYKSWIIIVNFITKIGETINKEGEYKPNCQQCCETGVVFQTHMAIEKYTYFKFAMMLWL